MVDGGKGKGEGITATGGGKLGTDKEGGEGPARKVVGRRRRRRDATTQGASHLGQLAAVDSIVSPRSSRMSLTGCRQ